MRNKFLILCFIIISPLQIFSQSNKTCESSGEDLLEDLNSITKCSIEESKSDSKTSKTKNVSVVVSSRRRVIRKRDAATGLFTTNYTHKLNGLSKKNNIIDNLSLNNAEGLKIIPFDFVDEIPLFKSCEKVSIYQQSKCFKKELSSHIKKYLRYPEEAYERSIQGKVLVYFIINKDGSIGKMNIRSPYKGKLLGEEAERIIKKLPKFKPGKHNGSEVTVKYGLPITFRIPGVKPSNIKKATKNIELKEIYAFNELETLPQFEFCKKSNDTSLDCFNKQLVQHIQENFAYPSDAVDNNIHGVVNVRFVINKDGEVVNIQTKGPANGKILEIAARNLIEKLPKFKSGTKNGNSVNVKYSFPVNFELD
ncbi:TonB family protein [Tenacibaculum adriaticum]|uniref:TonB family protein n=1 Tax=Tenacibaculum adriaticum TaxID=413713 RepID=A0A5S5DT14_9FLAO|nr:energy transducer TonB [Tenacibaculum adriaticum]TYP99031.1 TonB family protein [Tenacibaculum adriaticum]